MTITEQALGPAHGDSITAQVAELTGDGHGHHIPGTPMVYRHGFIPVDGTEVGDDGIRRPAKAGKSVPVKAAAPVRDTPAASAPHPPQANVKSILARSVGEDVKKDVAPLFEGDYGDGFSVKVDSASIISKPDGKVAEVNGSVYKDGRKVGIVVRGLHKGPDGHAVSNTELMLSPKYQGQGFASDFYKQTEARLKASGVKSAHLRANNDVGGFAWARKGFDWADPKEGQAKITEMAAWYAKQPHADPAAVGEIKSLASRARDPESASFPTPYDVSQVGHKPGAESWAGKQFLLGKGWDGVKQL